MSPTPGTRIPSLPSEEEICLAAESSRALARTFADGGLRVKLEDGTTLTLPQSAVELMKRILSEMSLGNALTIIPVHVQLTTQEAADFLNVSRPFLVKLLEAGKIKFRKVGTHRRIAFQDLMAYKERQQAESDRALEELSKQAQDHKMGY